ncbi:hypothetical protein CsSME_00046118 [Camellia sinensis var. sinensis]
MVILTQFMDYKIEKHCLNSSLTFLAAQGEGERGRGCEREVEKKEREKEGKVIQEEDMGVCIFLLGIPSSCRVMPSGEAVYNGESNPEGNQDEMLEPWFS